jgi:two-component system chemotaxis response regulator CheB
MTDDNLRVLVVDDTVTYRKIVSDLLAATPGVEVIGAAPNGKIALEKIERLRPDVVTLDLEMPEMDGLEVMRRLTAAGSEVGVIVLSGATSYGANTTVAALNAGAFDFVKKPDFADSRQNVAALEKALRSRIDAFSRKRQVQRILKEPAARPKVVSSPVASDVASRMSRIADQEKTPPEVVAIGISTGGPQSLNQMLPRLPGDLPAPVLIVQHMPPVFTKSLADDLDRRCALSVREAADGHFAKPGEVLIAPGGRQMKIVRKRGELMICITDDPPENSCRPSVDYLFRSVARNCGAAAVGVIMTGMGNDGSLGCRQMKQRGAAIIAQDEASCVVFGMPREPIEQGVADAVVPLDEIASQIVRLTERGGVACG